MSSSSSTTGLRRVLHNNASDIVALARWEPGLVSSKHGAGRRISPFEDARQTGYQEGYLAAQEESKAALDSSVEADRRRLCTALADAALVVSGTRVEAVATVTDEIVELALELAGVFLQRELTLSASLDAEALGRALALAPTDEDLTVRLHPDHTMEITQIEALAPGVAVKVIADPAIERGGCVLEVGPCRIDAQIKSALERAKALIAGADTKEDQR